MKTRESIIFALFLAMVVFCGQAFAGEYCTVPSASPDTVNAVIRHLETISREANSASYRSTYNDLVKSQGLVPADAQQMPDIKYDFEVIANLPEAGEETPWSYNATRTQITGEYMDGLNTKLSLRSSSAGHSDKSLGENGESSSDASLNSQANGETADSFHFNSTLETITAAWGEKIYTDPAGYGQIVSAGSQGKIGGAYSHDIPGLEITNAGKISLTANATAKAPGALLSASGGSRTNFSSVGLNGQASEVMRQIQTTSQLFGAQGTYAGSARVTFSRSE